MSSRRVGRAFRLLKACTLVGALAWNQLVAAPLMACMQSGDSEAVIDCPDHGDMPAHQSHASHAKSSNPNPSSETRVQCAESCESRALVVASTSAPVPERIGTVLSSTGAALALVHDDSNPRGHSVAPGVPPPRS